MQSNSVKLQLSIANLPMPLPILRVSNVATPQTLMRYFFQTERNWSGHLGEETNLDFGVAFTNPGLSSVKDANRIFDVALSAGLSPQYAFERVESHFAQHGTRCQEWLFNVSAAIEQTAPMIEWLRNHGFKEHREDVLYLEHLSLPSVSAINGIQVLPARASFRHAREFAEQTMSQTNPQITTQFIEASMSHLDDPHYEALLAIRDDLTIAKVGVLSVGEIGRIEPLFVAESFRRQGIGRMMMGRALEICARSLFKHVFLSCMPENEPAQSLYRSLGFVKIGQMIGYLAP